jgi:hypothetical protein
VQTERGFLFFAQWLKTGAFSRVISSIQTTAGLATMMATGSPTELAARTQVFCSSFARCE